jgi:ATP-binding cassette subfamily B (MDR/TAP) protein 1
LVLLATLPVSATILSIATRPLEYSIQAQRSDLAEASKHVNAAVNAIDLVKVFNGFEYEHRKYRYAIQNAAKHYLVQARCNSVQMGYVAFWVLAMFVAGFWYGMALVEQGMSAGSILTTFYATLACFQGIEALMPHWLVFSKGMSAGGFLLNVSRNHCRGKQTKDAKAQLRPNTCDGDVELSNVCVKYRPCPQTPTNNV